MTADKPARLFPSTHREVKAMARRRRQSVPVILDEAVEALKREELAGRKNAADKSVPEKGRT